jgi:predicted GH43/DUF377 family glycosyl hydrolase
MKRLLFFLCYFNLALGEELTDLEESPSDFVVDLFPIEIPDYPHAFNPSIIQWKQGVLLSFRVVLDAKLPYYSRLGLVWLDDDFRPLHPPQLLDTQEKTPTVPSRAEDGRLLTIGDRLYLVYSNCIEEKIARGKFRVHIGEISYDGESFRLEDPEPLLYFELENPNKREKNWIPFNYRDYLFLAYSISPHLVLCPLKGFNACDTVSCSENPIPWSFGELRGGTCALPSGEGDPTYLSFFHSSKKMTSFHSQGKETFHYFIGAYKFKNEPPFPITHISKEPIIAKRFYSGASYKPYWGSVQALFPCGFIQDDRYIWIAYGRQDHECWIAKLDKKGLMESLVEIEPLPQEEPYVIDNNPRS